MIKKTALINLAKSFKNRFLNERNKVFKYAFQHRLHFILNILMIMAMLVIIVSNIDRAMLIRDYLKGKQLDYLVHYTVLYKNIKVTCYNPTIKQCDKAPHIRADGQHVQFGDIAVSRDLIKEIPFGSLVIIKGKPYFVADVMGEYGSFKEEHGNTFVIKRFKQTRMMDILKMDYNEAANWGCQKLDVLVIPRGKEMFVPGFDKKTIGKEFIKR